MEDLREFLATSDLSETLKIVNEDSHGGGGGYDKNIPFLSGLVKLVFPNVDQHGQVFHYAGNVYRGIRSDYVDLVSSYFTSGLISALEEKNLIPKTRIVPYELPPFAFILQHEKVNNVSYAWEWSFSMLKDAALMCVDVMEELLDHGFTSQDGHPFNILFKDNKPVWLDITSFIKNDFEHSWAINEFFHRTYQPLEIMALQPPIARSILRDPRLFWGVMMFRSLSYKFGLKSKKHFPPSIRRYEKLFIKQGSQRDKNKIRRGLESYRKKIKSLHMNFKTFWSDYYKTEWFTKDKQILVSPSTNRFFKIMNILTSMPIKSIVEFGANEGYFSAMLALNNNIEKIVAIDYDENSVDFMYKSLSEHRLPEPCVKKIFPLVFDFVTPSEPVVRENLSVRTKSDAVVALALTHHLLLTQKMNIEKIFEQFSKFTNRFIFVEFMPRGMWWPGAETPPPVPEWYTEEWFVKNMEKKFRILYREEFGHRTLFVGELKNF